MIGLSNVASYLSGIRRLSFDLASAAICPKSRSLRGGEAQVHVMDVVSIYSPPIENVS